MEQETQQAIERTNTATLVGILCDHNYQEAIPTPLNIVRILRGSERAKYLAIITRINRLATLHAQLD